MESTFSHRLKQFRLRVEMSQAQFAERAGIEQVSVSQIERGRSKPSLETAAKIMQAFPSINPDWFLYGRGDMLRTDNATASPPPPTPPSPLRQVDESEEIKALKRDNEFLRNQVLLLTDIIRSGGSLRKTGTDDPSFILGDRPAAEQPAHMEVLRDVA